MVKYAQGAKNAKLRIEQIWFIKEQNVYLIY